MSFSKIRVAVLRGGPSREYEVSLKTGANVMRNLPESYHPIDVFVSKDNVWHVGGVSRNHHQVLGKIDVIFNALHGEYGEDGKIQHLLESHNIPFTGPNRFAAALSMNKAKTKEVYKRFGIKTPYSKIIRQTEDLDSLTREIYLTFPMPCVLKPVASGSSVGVYIVGDYQSLLSALEKLFATEKSVLAEEYIRGKEATCGVIDNYRNEKIYALLPVEIIPPTGHFFDYESKYSEKTKEICPGNFNREEGRDLQDLARRAHQALGLRHYSRSDFIIHPTRGIYTLETNSLPGLTAESIFPKSLEAVGTTLSDFLKHVIDLAKK